MWGMGDRIRWTNAMGLAVACEGRKGRKEGGGEGGKDGGKDQVRSGSIMGVVLAPFSPSGRGSLIPSCCLPSLGLWSTHSPSLPSRTCPQYHPHSICAPYLLSGHEPPYTVRKLEAQRG